MKALILSCNTGGGHNSAGRAVAEEFVSRGDEAYVLDYLTLAGQGVSRIVGNGYVQIVKKTPKLFGVAYHLGMLVSRLMKKSPVYYLNGRMARYLDDYLQENPVDVIIMPHLYPAETITYMKRKGMKLPLTVAIMTDYTCIPFWEETDCDYYTVPHKRLIPSCIRRGLPKEKLIPAGIPVAAACRKDISKKDARNKLGLLSDGRYILVAGGSMGAGDLARIVKLLLEETKEAQIFVVCGSNRKIETGMKKEFLKEERVHVIGYTSQMALYMKACDVLFTKPGGLTSTEAAAVRVPMVHTDPIPGCESANRKFFVKLGMSVSAKTVKGQVKQGLFLLNDQNMASNMMEKQKENVDPDTASGICDFIYKKIQHDLSEC